MLHGLGYAGWETAFLRAAVDADIGLWSLDNRGTGRSDPLTGSCSIDDLAADAARAIDALGGPMVVLGHSMGGYIAQALARAHPEKVAGLILVATSPGGPRATPVPDETTRAWLAAADLPPAEFARATMPLAFRPGWTREHPARFEQILSARLASPTPSETWRAQFAACAQFLSADHDPRDIAVPTVVIHGTADRIVPVENGRLLAETMPAARSLELPGAGHLPHLEDPALIGRHISAFIHAHTP
nr:alpha/beta hydrolase [Microbacterium aquimaris]